MRVFSEIWDADRLESRANMLAVIQEAYSRELTSAARQQPATKSNMILDLGTHQDLYGIQTLPNETDRTMSLPLQETSRRLSANSDQAAENNDNSNSTETPAQVDSLPENTPANFNVETPSSGYADEAPESNSNPTHGVPDSDAVPTESQAVPVAALAAANTNAFSPCCNSTNQEETIAPDPEGINVEGETEGPSAATADSSNNNSPANDADGANGTGGNSSGQGGGGDTGSDGGD